MIPQSITFAAMDAADPNGVSVSQTPAGGGVQSLSITGALATGGVATMDVARKVDITSAGDDSGRTFTVTGTDRYGDDQTETVTGANTGIATTVKDYLTVTAITTDDDTAAAVEAGSSDSAATAWMVVDVHRNSTNIGFGMAMSSDANFTHGVEHTFDNPFQGPPTNVFPHMGAAAAYTTPITAFRLAITDYVAGSGVLNYVQAGLVGD